MSKICDRSGTTKPRPRSKPGEIGIPYIWACQCWPHKRDPQCPAAEHTAYKGPRKPVRICG
jgi:hypothetical protein